MKTKNLFFIALMTFTILTFANESLPKSPSELKTGEIIGFDMLKCGCCWGWIIKVENDTIKADNLPANVKYSDFMESDSIKYPIKIKIEIGAQLDRCTRDFNYYEIEHIALIKQ